MTTIAVYGATGWLGSKIVAEAASRGHQVTALARHAEPSSDGNVVTAMGDASDPAAVARIAAEHEVVVSAIGPSREPGGDHQQYLDALAVLTDNLGNSRLIVVGGAGSLVTPGGVRLVDTPAFPDAYKRESLTGVQALVYLRELPDSVNWTYLSPAPEIAPGERTGRFTLSDDTPAGDKVSDADYAVALVDEIEQPAHSRRRFTVAN